MCAARVLYMFVSKTDRLDQLQVAADSCYIYGIIVHQIVRLLLSEQSMCVEEVSACYAMGFNTSKVWGGGIGRVGTRRISLVILLYLIMATCNMRYKSIDLQQI